MMASFGEDRNQSSTLQLKSLSDNTVKYLKENFSVVEKNGILTSEILEETVTTVTDFYEISPFPNYNGFETDVDFSAHMRRNSFLKELKDFVGFNKDFIEVGSGTSQLSVFIASGSNNRVVALDPTLPSLKLGQEFASSAGVNNVTFLNADLFDDPIKPSSFDVVWCSGVLHHTRDTKKGFEVIVKWCRPNGIVIIGLYNRYSRLFTQIRKILFKMLGKGEIAKKLVMFLDPYLRNNAISEEKTTAWFRDQYDHPVERTHSLCEVLDWFKQNDIEFMGSIPNCNFEETDEKLDEMSGNSGTRARRIASQIKQLFSTHGGEGGLFLVVGRYRPKNIA